MVLVSEFVYMAMWRKGFRKKKWSYERVGLSPGQSFNRGPCAHTCSNIGHQFFIASKGGDTELVTRRPEGEKWGV